jgi:N-acyl-D-aspartate/D-glutamate deacylase
MAEFDVVCEVAADDPLHARVEASWANDEVDGVTSLLQASGCILGLSDAGAHVNQMCDAVQPTDFLANWVRDREIMPLEEGVRKLSSELADVLQIDRGRIQVGTPADVLVIDLAELDPGQMRRVKDMPAEGERLVADRPKGYRHVFVNGVQTVRDNESIAARLSNLPGKVLRSAKTEGR